MKKNNDLPKMIWELGELPDGEYIANIVGMKTKNPSNTSMICSFDIEISLEENGFNNSGKVRKSKGFYENGKSFLTSFLQEFEVIADNGEIDWEYFANNTIPVSILLETNAKGGQYVTDVIPQYEEAEEYEDE